MNRGVFGVAFAVLAAAVVLLLAVGAVAPGASRWLPWYAPGWTHVLSYGLLGALLVLTLRRGSAALALAVALGLLTELLQLLVSARQASPVDALLNGVGAVLGVAGGMLVLRGRHGGSRRADEKAAPEPSVAGSAAALAEQVAQLASDRLLQALPLLLRRGQVSPAVAAIGAQTLSRSPRSGNAPLADRAVFEALAEAGVPALAMKGSLLAFTVYDAPEQRFRGDTDVLVPPHQRRAAEAALSRLGLVRGWSVTAKTSDTQDQWVGTIGADPVVIDLHREVLNHPAFSQVFDFDALWQRRRSFEMAGAEIQGLGAVDALLHAALHYYAHHGDEFRPAQWLLDGDLLWRAMDDSERAALVDRSVEHGVAGIVASYLALTEARFHSGIGPDVLWRLEREGRRQWRSALLHLDGRPIRALIFTLRALPNWRARFRHLRLLLVPTAEYMRTKYPGSPRWALPWLYVRRALEGIRR